MKKSLLLIILAALVIAIANYIYYPFTRAGCEKLKGKIEENIAAISTCNLAAGCVYSYNLDCDFNCAGYFNQKPKQSLISRYNRRCQTCTEECYFEYTNPVCLEHTCQSTGGAVSIKTNKEEYEANEKIGLEVKNNLLSEIIYPFPIELCLRPTIVRLEKYNEETKGWLSDGVGLLFTNNEITFYQNPDECPSYKIKNCTKDKAKKFIDESTLKVKEGITYTLNSASILPCDIGKETPQNLQGHYRIALYYEPATGPSGDQIYSNEFVVK